MLMMPIPGPTVTVTNEEVPPTPPALPPITPFELMAYIGPYDRTPLDRLPNPASVTPIPSWMAEYGRGQIAYYRDQAFVAYLGMAQAIHQMAADAPASATEPQGAMMNRQMLGMAYHFLDGMRAEVDRYDGLAQWWDSIPVSDYHDPFHQVFP